MVHESSLSLGYVDTDACSVLDYLPSDFWGTCFSCVHEVPFTELHRAQVCICNSVHVSIRGKLLTFFQLFQQPSEKICRNCYARVRVHAEEVVVDFIALNGMRNSLSLT